MVTILYDLYRAQPAGNSKFHGGGEYSKRIYRELFENYSDKCKLTVYYDDTRFINDWIKESFESPNVKVCVVHSMDDVQKVFLEEEYDIFFSGVPYDYGNMKFRSGVLKRGTVHGLRRVEDPIDKYEYLYETRLSKIIKSLAKPYFRKSQFKKYWGEMKPCIDYLDGISTVSTHSKYSIANFYPYAAEKVHVFYSPLKYREDCNDTEPIVKEKYALMLGGNREEKNGYRTLLALDGLYDNGFISDLKVVIVGKLPNAVKKKIKHVEHIIEYEYVEPEVLENLYKFCDMFLFTSINEGFGIPPLEIMRYGKTCIVSGVCSMPEIYGDAVYYVNPYDISEIRNRILMAYDRKIDPEIISKRVDYISKIQERDLKGLCEFIIEK